MASVRNTPTLRLLADAQSEWSSMQEEIERYQSAQDSSYASMHAGYIEGHAKRVIAAAEELRRRGEPIPDWLAECEPAAREITRTGREVRYVRQLETAQRNVARIPGCGVVWLAAAALPVLWLLAHLV